MSNERQARMRAPGIVLIAAGAITVAAILHHPTGDGDTNEEFVASIVQAGAMLRVVHGAMIALLLAMAYGVAAYALRRGLGRPLPLAGLLTFLTGILVMMPAALIDGFILPDFAAQAQANNAEVMATFPAVSRFAMDMLLALAKASSVLISLGIVLLSLGMMHERGVMRWFGLAGVVGVFPGALAILAGKLQLDLHGMTLITVVWCAWFGGLGALLLRGKV
jgi:hypothetical protein